MFLGLHYFLLIKFEINFIYVAKINKNPSSRQHDDKNPANIKTSGKDNLKNRSYLKQIFLFDTQSEIKYRNTESHCHIYHKVKWICLQ